MAKEINKKNPPKVLVKETAEKTVAKKNVRYIEAIGRRKTSTARVRIFPAAKESFMINGKDGNKYFATDELYKIISDPFNKTKLNEKWSVTVLVSGGGYHSQAEAIRHGLSRALVAHDEGLRVKIKKMGFLKRDPRMKERRKFGLKKARKAPTWSKR